MNWVLEHMGDPGVYNYVYRVSFYTAECGSVHFGLIIKPTCSHTNVVVFTDFSTPFEPPQPKSKSSAGPTLSEDSIAMVMSLGFSREQAVKALKATVRIELSL